MSRLIFPYIYLLSIIPFRFVRKCARAFISLWNCSVVQLPEHNLCGRVCLLWPGLRVSPSLPDLYFSQMDVDGNKTNRRTVSKCKSVELRMTHPCCALKYVNSETQNIFLWKGISKRPVFTNGGTKKAPGNHQLSYTYSDKKKIVQKWLLKRSTFENVSARLWKTAIDKGLT